MLREDPQQVEKPRPHRRWPQVANRHRRKAMEEAKAILDLIDQDFLTLLQEDVGDDIEEALEWVRLNPARAIRHLQLALRSIRTIVRSAQLVHNRAESIFRVLDSAPADDNGEQERNGEIG